jgi:hypothetical protein
MQDIGGKEDTEVSKEDFALACKSHLSSPWTLSTCWKLASIYKRLEPKEGVEGAVSHRQLRPQWRRLSRLHLLSRM